MQLISASILPCVAFNKDAFPQPPAQQTGWTNHSARQDGLNLKPDFSKPSFSRPSFSRPSFSRPSRFQAKVSKRKIRLSFALRSQAAQLSKAIARNIDLPFLEPFTRAGSRQRALANRVLRHLPVASTLRIHPPGHLRGQKPWTDVVAGT